MVKIECDSQGIPWIVILEVSLFLLLSYRMALHIGAKIDLNEANHHFKLNR